MPRVVGGWILVWLLTLAGATSARARVWVTPVALWTDATRVTPQKPRPFINLGLAKFEAGDFEGAFEAQATALGLSFQPRLSRYQQVFSRVASETNIAILLSHTGQEGPALQMLNQVLAAHPHFPHARYNRGVLLARLGQCAAGLVDNQIARALDPAFPPLVCAPPP